MPSRKHPSPSGKNFRLWREAYQCVLVLDRDWDEPVRRQRALTACRDWLTHPQADLHLAALARLIKPGMTRRDFEALRVPLERVANRRRVTDAQILDRDLEAPPAAPEPMPLILVADCLRSAFNLGGLLRTVECMGAASLWMCGYCAGPDHPRVRETALGCETLVPTRRFDRLVDAIGELRTMDYSVVALETAVNAVPLQKHAWRFPCALLVGNERFGLDTATLKAADDVVRIPMFGRKNSLNVVSATAIALQTARLAFGAKR